MYILSKDIYFPDPEMADEDGFIAMGGDLQPERLLEAYRRGIFPWYNEEDPICWWSPDPRCVLYPADVHVSKSMDKLLRSNHFSFTMNTAFEMVMRNCSNIKRKGEQGTWIHHEMISAYTVLYEKGYAASAETWHNGNLVGGLYGVMIGRIFYGESMFSSEPNASKFAFIHYCRQLVAAGVIIIDCQMHTAHLESMGAIMIPRKKYLEIVRKNTG